MIIGEPFRVGTKYLADCIEDVVAGEIGAERIGQSSATRARDRILRQFGLGMYVDHSAEYQDHIVTVTLEAPGHVHQWTSITNEAIDRGEMCECGRIRWDV